jgi:uncharacterized protein
VTTRPEAAPSEVTDTLQLLDWKRRVFALYASVRADDNPEAAWQRWRSTRDALFATHPQSPLGAADRAGFVGLDYYPYDPASRVVGRVGAAEPTPAPVTTSDGSQISFRRVGVVSFVVACAALSLELYWLDGYGGGVFLPFRDATSGRDSYGGGRYLLDTVKGADLGGGDTQLTLDFNFAYNPSCSYADHWACPLAPAPNWLAPAIRAGERATPPVGSPGTQ